MSDLKISPESLGRQNALKLLQATPDAGGQQKRNVSASASLQISGDAMIEEANARIIKILIDALGNADISVDGAGGTVGVTTEGGDDRISATGAQATLVTSGAGNDAISITTSGKDFVQDGYLMPAVDLVMGEDGDDVISISSHGNVDRTEGGAGNDKITISSTSTPKNGVGQQGIDRTEGGDGDDEMLLTSASDVMRTSGGNGDDSVTIQARGWVWNVEGGDGNDKLTVTAETDKNISGVYGGSGNDVIRLKAGSMDNVEGGEGDDYLILETTPNARNTVYFGEGDGHDMVETNNPLEIRRFNSDGTNVVEADMNVRQNGDGTVTIEFTGSTDSITVKFTGDAKGGELMVEPYRGGLIVSPKLK
jgi:hypothetical protein